MAEGSFRSMDSSVLAIKLTLSSSRWEPPGSSIRLVRVTTDWGTQPHFERSLHPTNTVALPVCSLTS